MIAENNTALSEAAQTIYEANLEDMEKLKCRARHDYYKMKNIAEAHLKEVTEERDSLAKENTILSNENTALSNENTALSNENTALSNENTALSNENTALSNENARLLARIAELEQKNL